MQKEKIAGLPEKCVAFLADNALVSRESTKGLKVEPLAADGSLRQFYRICEAQNSYILVLPADESDQSLREVVSCCRIGEHLKRSGVDVPTIHATDVERGLLVYEDLGNSNLHQMVLEAKDPWNDGTPVDQTYRRVIEGLVSMQLRGAEGFDTAWCWDWPYYDRKVMVERESQYFLNSFCRDYLGLEWSGEVVEECDDLADRASQYRSGYFLHRDFQSRNIMLLNDRVVFIDYQAGRLGPIGYDIASLLLDPYVAMPPDIREQYLGYYMKCLRENGVETGGFELSYRVLSLQRNLQIIGAFAFLTQKRNKLFFKQFLKPALVHLATLLGDHFPSYRALADLVGRSRQLLLQA